MIDETDATAQSTAVEGNTDSVIDEPLPAAIGERVQVLFGLDDRPATFGVWTTVLRSVFEDERGHPLRLDDLCRVDGSRHEARVDDETYHFQCVLDALVLPAFVDEPVSVRSVDPVSDAVVTARVTRTAIETTPSNAVVSFGIVRNHDERDTSPTTAVAYGALCPAVNAFSTRTTYERWDQEPSDIVTTVLSVADAFALARELAG